jgi:hypothetical protein
MDASSQPGDFGNHYFSHMEPAKAVISTPLGMVEVTTGPGMAFLFREPSEYSADIVVLADFERTTCDARWIGWEWDSDMRRCHAQVSGYNLIRWYRPASELRPIRELLQLMDESKRVRLN